MIVSAVYCRSHHPSSLLLRTVMWSPWSHTATIVPGDSVIDARFWGGVRRRPLRDVIQEASHYRVREWDVPDAQAGYAWLEAQIGRRYDTAGVLGIGLHRDWQEDDSWFCSELHEEFLRRCGLQRFFDGSPRRITPQISWMVA